MSKITKKDFLAAAKKGWRKLGYIDGAFYGSKTGRPLSGNEARRAASACIIGAAAVGLGIKDALDLGAQLGRQKPHLWDDVADASNMAGSKTAALKAVSKIKWRTA